MEQNLNLAEETTDIYPSLLCSVYSAVVFISDACRTFKMAPEGVPDSMSTLSQQHSVRWSEVTVPVSPPWGLLLSPLLIPADSSPSISMKNGKDWVLTVFCTIVFFLFYNSITSHCNYHITLFLFHSFPIISYLPILLNSTPLKSVPFHPILFLLFPSFSTHFNPISFHSRRYDWIRRQPDEWKNCRAGSQRDKHSDPGSTI